ncbi:hypothetical protein PILCRDRAFT_820053 [Piloderma croceum F 1598]|uniref:Uncharacterized protein n=1 Tax=Piloderma croceum (strain F 1598) TaxID=765440 RepID=A0A0C3B8Z5_PILCF|nr:hypothetical protein PILCRDRAFT_820053 [Piloderma croceum F 1598]
MTIDNPSSTTTSNNDESFGPHIDISRSRTRSPPGSAPFDLESIFILQWLLLPLDPPCASRARHRNRKSNGRRQLSYYLSDLYSR